MEDRVLQVLIAEDDSVLADVLQFNLQRAGFAVTTVESGDAAVEQLRTGTFDLLISDFQMPGLTGEQVCQVVREELKLTDLPILLCTAKGLEIDADRLQSKYRTAAVIFKPFSMRNIVSLARSLTETCTAEA